MSTIDFKTRLAMANYYQEIADGFLFGEVVDEAAEMVQDDIREYAVAKLAELFGEPAAPARRPAAPPPQPARQAPPPRRQFITRPPAKKPAPPDARGPCSRARAAAGCGVVARQAQTAGRGRASRGAGG